MRVDAQVTNPCDNITVSYGGYDYTANLFGSICWFTQNMRNTQYADGMTSRMYVYMVTMRVKLMNTDGSITGQRPHACQWV